MVASQVGTINDNSDLTSYSFGTIGYTAGRLYVLFSIPTGGTVAEDPTIAGTASLTFTKRGTRVSQDVMALTIWTAIAGADGSGTILTNFGSTKSGMNGHLIEVPSGFDPASLVFQTVLKNQAATTSITIDTGTTAWTNSGDATKIVIAAFGCEAGGAPSITSSAPPLTMLDVGSLSHTTPSAASRSGYANGGVSSIVMSQSGSSTACVMGAIEINALAGGGSGGPFAFFFKTRDV